jgi:VWFA-related protein
MGSAVSGCFGGSVFCFAFLAALPALAQAPDHADKPEISNTENDATFRSKVTLVTVPVVVRDRHGNAVGDLKKEDFQVFDKGKLRAISKFAIERANMPDVVLEEMPAAGAPGLSTRPFGTIANQFVAYVFDDLHLDAANLSVVRPAAEKNLAGLAPNARAAIFTTSGVTMLDFTNDRAKLYRRPHYMPITSQLADS